MPTVLIVHHTPSPALQEMFEAVSAGAGTELIVSRPPLSRRSGRSTPRTECCWLPRRRSAQWGPDFRQSPVLLDFQRGPVLQASLPGRASCSPRFPWSDILPGVNPLMSDVRQSGSGPGSPATPGIEPAGDILQGTGTATGRACLVSLAVLDAQRLALEVYAVDPFSGA